ncbi:Hypothetical protein CINCED_3A016353 [Cinara cedri]|uniref:Uncharacterized protein n=1 Tax=Cinara cedri TaxID=506608 RepID=A0A5E4MVQ8_9HEMI|nr:Hypothetical protein CINCED_3A016353 [Cinara cedri]
MSTGHYTDKYKMLTGQYIEKYKMLKKKKKNIFGGVSSFVYTDNDKINSISRNSLALALTSPEEIPSAFAKKQEKLDIESDAEMNSENIIGQ